MRKQLLYLTGLLFPAISASAQLTLTQASFSGTYTTYDTVYKVSSMLGLPSNIYGTGTSTSATWDFSNMLYAGPDSVMYMPAPTGYTFQQFRTDTLSSPFLYLPSRGYYTINSAAYQQNVYRLDRKPYCLLGVVLGATISDSLVFDAQLDTLSAPRTIIKFPAGFSSPDNNWSSTYDVKTYYTVKAPSLSMPNAPGHIIRHHTESDSVKGWGKVIIKRADGTRSTAVDVLQVKVRTERVDSFFLNGSPAPSSLMQPPYLQQGNTRVEYTNKYYRPNEITPLVEVSYTDASYNTVSKVTVHSQRTFPNSINTLGYGNSIVVYPDPVQGRSINIDLPSAANDWSYTMINVSGQTVGSGTISKGQTKATLVLPELSPGTYSLQLLNDDINTTKTLQITQ